MSNERLDRRTSETVALAMIAMLAVMWVRYRGEVSPFYWTEWVVAWGLAVSSVAFARRLAYGLVALPIVTTIVGRLIGMPMALEMTLLTMLVHASLPMALLATTERIRAMSMVLSGFGMLFVTAINDDSRSVVVAILWMAICVWHLVANHWERIGVCMPETVRPAFGVRPWVVLLAVSVCLLGGWTVRGRIVSSHPLQWGFMPTSGGSKWSDPSARSGVGSGDAAIAARDHAESFGAVESDIFLESTESSLFDLFNDMIGEPKVKRSSEKAQSMSSENLIESHARNARSEQGGASFSTNRMAAPKHQHFEDATSRAIVQWAGPTGIRLAMHRFDRFDGVDWFTSKRRQGELPLSRERLGEEDWFFVPNRKDSALADPDPQIGVVKILRLDSTRIPAPMSAAAVHIRDVDRTDFFAVTGDDSLVMSGREKIPALTVINVASTKIWEDDLWSQLPAQVAIQKSSTAESVPELELESGLAEPPTAAAGQLSPSMQEELRDYANQVTAGINHPYAQVQAIVRHLRREFRFDREFVPAGDNPVRAFLRQRRGGDHLFATTTALLIRQLGLQTRLVSGFYVSPAHRDYTAGHTEVYAEDVHLWVEVKLDDQRWFAVEPTPGYQPPVYRPSIWLACRQWVAANWSAVGLAMVIVIGIWVTRIRWLNAMTHFIWWASRPLPARRRLRLAMWILQTRGRLAGTPRAAGRPQRDWLLGLAGQHAELGPLVRRVCDAADQLAWRGSGSYPASVDMSRLVRRMPLSFFRQQSCETSA